MARDHKRCDELYADGEAAGLDGNWEEGGKILSGFVTGMLHHFNMEEKVFFPAFEEETGMTEGPTTVMRMEHEQMRELLGQMKECISSGDYTRVLSIGETLLILMQQHNMKEEQMLYPMADMHISEMVEGLLKKMQLQD
ncbi:MAG: hemerythrin domain-containing protein [Nitrospinae bacterium]|nr:hemerythrin domain-containing protein [Nitrospinota bacterium]